MRACCAWLVWLVALACPASTLARPRLGALVVVDQLSADTFARFSPRATGGFRRLLREGWLFQRARHDAMPTVTGVGHANLLTGAYPEVHGVVANEWYDLDRRASVYVGEDPAHHLHGRPPKEDDGVSPRLLAAPTLGDALKASVPGGKVVALAGKDRSAIIGGGQSANAAVWFDAELKGFTTSSYYGASTPAWVEPVNAAVRKKLPPMAAKEAVYDFEMSADIDDALVALAEQALTAEALGADETPDLLVMSFSSLDYVGHIKGTDTPELQRKFEEVDRALGRLMDVLDRKVGRGKYVLAVTGDHGGSHSAERLKSLGIDAGNIAMKDLVLRLNEEANKQLGKGTWIVEFDAGGFYVTADAREKVRSIEPALQRAARSVLGIAGLLAADRLERSHPVESLFLRGYWAARSPQYYVLARPNWVFGRGPANHGTHHLYDRSVPLLLYGEGVRGGRANFAEAIDVAPTLAQLMEIEPPAAATGRVLEQCMQNASR